MFRIVCDPSSGSIELYLTEIIRSGSQMFVVCLVGVWQRNFEPVMCVCTVGRAGSQQITLSALLLDKLTTTKIDVEHLEIIHNLHGIRTYKIAHRMVNSSLLLFFSNISMPSNIGRQVITERLATLPTSKSSLSTRLVCVSPKVSRFQLPKSI